MVLSFEQVGTLMDEIADSFPEEFYEELNGSVLLLQEEKLDPDALDLYVMGAYCRDQIGRYIEIYYGSFAQLAQQEDWSEADWHQELWDTLSHEFTHHLESLAGEWSLEDKDEAFMEHYWSERNRKKNRKGDNLSPQNP
ncbi:MAG: hypothetical protein K0S60_18 [Evtepia sp.]|jgi:hypothetical protein|nr:hypothetical protein [Evtepia sp.]